MADFKPLLPLTDDQARASTPNAQIWLAASAGTGKTQVLSARVLRLLLQKEAPDSLLCLTFTKSGAAEMAERVHSRLASWVRAPKKNIHSDLAALGEPRDEECIAFARTLFARVLDARGGGLRIQTIHSFCQTLLASFPAEADLTPGFRPLDERDARKLTHTVLADLVSNAIASRDLGFIARLQRLVLDKNDDVTQRYLMKCARVAETLAMLGGGIEARVRRSLSLAAEDVEPFITIFCSDAHIDRAMLVDIQALNAKWGTSRGKSRAAIIEGWLKATPDERATKLEALMQVWLRQDGEFRSFEKSQAPQDQDYESLCHHQQAYFSRLIDQRRRQRLAHQISDALLVGQYYARAYAEAKRAQGLVDFDDLISKTETLLRQPGMGDWIRYKLDSGIHHILVDEAQDTNDAQWAIIEALAAEFYVGRGQAGEKVRTIFTVGDTKQAIFGFQGSDPEAMMRARDWFAAKTRDGGQDFNEISLQGSFRSSPPILQLVDTVIAQLGPQGLGLGGEVVTHQSQIGHYGNVLLLKPITNLSAPEHETSEGQGETDVSTQHVLARDIARRVASWLENKLPLEDRHSPASAPLSRSIEPRDIMILLRSRSKLAQLIVAHLSEAEVPVAGVDRLRLNTPLVIRDVLAALHFALQPNDDLNLACLLVSPLLGWSQDELQAVAVARGRLSLWRYVRATAAAHQLAPLKSILNLGDRLTPARFIETLLSGELRGRMKCLARFGAEARDPLDELLNSALLFERDHVPSLQVFVDWFERDMDDIKRDAVSRENAVRVMTVHGAKGLQAPLVILADATLDPEQAKDDILDWPLDDKAIPIPMPRSTERVDEISKIIDAANARKLEEHGRLLYVALTRAEERLVIMGAQGSRPISPKSWYSNIENAMVTLGARVNEDGSREHGTAAPQLNDGKQHRKVTIDASPRPVWLDAPAPREARPARPLSPSSYTADHTAQPPAAKLRAAAARGRMLHALFERLPEVSPSQRAAVADAWLANVEFLADPGERSSLIADALRIIDHPEFFALFGPDALAEAPLAGVVNGVVVAGTVDRLLITPDSVLVVDFKTTRRAPSAQSRIPEAHLRQMAAYRAVLASIFPDRRVQAALLYTAAPVLFALDDAQLDAHNPSFQLEQQVLAARA